MIHYTSFNYQNLIPLPTKKKTQIYDDNIYTLDMEVTSVFENSKGELEPFLFKPQVYYRQMHKHGFMYIWQMAVNGVAVFGRTYSDLIKFFKNLLTRVKNRIIVYIHNLSYEFQFLRNFINDFTVFERKPRHPIYAVTECYNIEFRCSLMLTNTALANIPRDYNLNIKKMVGDLDYNLIRTHETPLTEKEMQYCENDVLILHEVILWHRNIYKHIHKIPLTQTGKVRRELKTLCYQRRNIFKQNFRMSEKTVEGFKLLVQAFSGGYTHANAIYTDTVLTNVKSADIASSYPYTMLIEGFPHSQFKQCNTERNRKDECYIYDVEYINIRSNLSMNYLSKSRAVNISRCLNDNGRVESAERCRYILTDVDYNIVEEVYSYDEKIIHAKYFAKKRPLNSILTNFILDLYERKTQLKGLEGHESVYLSSKQMINSLYGMCVTNTIRDEVEFMNDWSIKELTRDEVVEKLNEEKNNPVNYAWGVWVTAYARRNLWDIIKQISDNVVYTDTDSVKYIGDCEEVFKKYNQNVLERINFLCKTRRISPDRFAPKNRKGVKNIIGIYEQETTADEFKTLGAKKYCAVTDGKIKLTVSGVSKIKGLNVVKTIEDFKPGAFFDYTDSGKTIMFYNDKQHDLIVTDYEGRTTLINQKYGICALPTTYRLNVTSDYRDYLNAKQLTRSTHLNILKKEYMQQ